MATFEEKLAALAEANWPLGDDPILGILQDAAALGDSEGYARGRAEALSQAADYVEAEFARYDVAHHLRNLDQFRALAQRTQGEG